MLYLADSEAVEYICCRRFDAEPRSPALTIDTSAWAEMLGYFHQIRGKPCESSQVFDALRTAFWQLCGNRCRIHHSIIRFTAKSIWRYGLQIQERRIPAQIDRMKENYRGWLKLNPPSKSPSNHHPEKKAGPMSAGTC